MISSGRRRLFLGLTFLGLLATALAVAKASPGLPYGRSAGWVVALLALLAVFPALRLVREQVLAKSLKTGDLLTMAPDRMPTKEGSVFIGQGFAWTPDHAERLYNAAALGIEPPQELQAKLGGNPLLHGLGILDEKDLFMESSRLPQHVLILGSPGWGKSRYLEFLQYQLIRQGDIVVVIDPKGDKRLLNAMVDAAEKTGRSKDFRLISPPWSQASCAYNPLTNFSSPKDIADRIMGIFPPGGGESEAFRGYQWGAVHAVAQAIAMADLPMTIVNVLRYVRNPSELFYQLVERRFKDRLASDGLQRAEQQYVKLVASGQMERRPELDDILAYANEDANYYAKMTGSLRPQLERLAAGILRDILSPDPGTVTKELVTWSSVIHQGQIVYFHLGSLHGEESAKALGKMILLDFQTFIAKLYSYHPAVQNRRIALIIDEAHHMISKPFLNILAEGRGANIACILATQTTAQFEEAMGSKAAVNEVLTNCHALVHFQSRNPEECKAFCDLVGKRRMRTRGEAHRYEAGFFGAGLKNIDDFRAQYTQNFTWQDADLLPWWAIPQLPTFHYFARLGGRIIKARVPLLDPPRSAFAEDLIEQGAAA